MKTNLIKIKALIMIVAGSFYSCKDDGPVPVLGQITMTSMQGEIRLFAAGSGTMTVKSGDGAKIETYSLQPYEGRAWPYFLGDYEFNIKELSDLITIEGENITHLACIDNLLTSLNVSKNPALTFLNCLSNPITSLDVSNNAMLTYLDCCNNQLTNLDVSNNAMLTYLNCSDNHLTNLDVNSNVVLTQLYCYSTELSNLDLSNNPMLTYLGCSYSQLTYLDLSSNVALLSLHCSGNKLTSLNLSNSAVLLTTIYCDRNQLSTEALNNLFRTLNGISPVSSAIWVFDNPGSDDCDTSIATEKGWHVFTYSHYY